MTLNDNTYKIDKNQGIKHHERVIWSLFYKQSEQGEQGVDLSEICSGNLKAQHLNFLSILDSQR